MTDLTPDPDDELASAYLDDEVTADERARVEGDPVLQARVARLQAARDELVAAAIDFPSATARRRSAAAGRCRRTRAVLARRPRPWPGPG